MVAAIGLPLPAFIMDFSSCAPRRTTHQWTDEKGELLGSGGRGGGGQGYLKSQPRVWTARERSGSGQQKREELERANGESEGTALVMWQQKTQCVTPSLGATRTYFGPTRQLCERRLEEEGGHDEVDFRNVNVVGQKVVQDPESRKQAGALVGRGRVALQVIYGSEGAHNATENNCDCFWPRWGLAHEGIPCHPLPPEMPERDTRRHTGTPKMLNKAPFPIPDMRTHQDVRAFCAAFHPGSRRQAVLKAPAQGRARQEVQQQLQSQHSGAGVQVALQEQQKPAGPQAQEHLLLCPRRPTNANSMLRDDE